MTQMTTPSRQPTTRNATRTRRSGDRCGSSDPSTRRHRRVGARRRRSQASLCCRRRPQRVDGSILAMTLAAEHTSTPKIARCDRAPHSDPSVAACAIGSIQLALTRSRVCRDRSGDSAIYTHREQTRQHGARPNAMPSRCALVPGEGSHLRRQGFRLHWDVDPVPLWFGR